MPKVLIVDDRPLDARTAARVLAARGFEVVTASSPFGFGELLQREKPDLALVDVKMPALGGDVLVRITRNRPGGYRCPMVLWSSKSVSELETLARESLASGYIQKRGSPEEFVHQVRRFLRREPA